MREVAQWPSPPQPNPTRLATRRKRPDPTRFASHRFAAGKARGMFSLALGDPEGALAELEGAVDGSPDCPAAWAFLGRANLELHRWERAVACFRRAVELQPDCKRALEELVLAMVAAGKLREVWSTHPWNGRHSKSVPLGD